MAEATGSIPVGSTIRLGRPGRSKPSTISSMRAPLLAVCLLLAACSGDEPEPRARKAPPMTAAPAPDYACPNQEAVIEDVSLRTGITQSGDVDADGDADTVSVHYDAEGAPGCQGFVVVETAAGGILSGALETWRSEFGLPMPTLNRLADVDGEPGEDVVVNMGAGASTQFVGVVVEDGGVLRQVTTDVPGQAADGMFAFGGSVGHIEAVDCAPEGIRVSFATPDGDVYRVERRLFHLSGTELVQDAKDVERVPIEELDRFPEYAASPFGSCS